MGTANLDGLRKYVCTRPVGGPVGKDVVQGHAFNGNEAMGILKGEIAGIDVNKDGQMDLYAGASMDVLARFEVLLQTNPAYANYDASDKVWEPPVDLPLSRVKALVSHCQEWDDQNKKGVLSVAAVTVGGVSVAAGGVGFYLGATLSAMAPFLIVGVALIGLGIFFYHSVYNQLDSSVSQQTHQALTDMRP